MERHSQEKVDDPREFNKKQLGDATRPPHRRHRHGRCRGASIGIDWRRRAQNLTSPISYEGEKHMTTITTKDGTQIYYKDWGTGQPIVFSHGWPLTADDWDAQMLFFGQHGYRVIAHDRRGHGRSTQTWDGNEMDTYADDLAALTQELDLKDAIHVGHSTGGGEVARYIGRHGTKRVARAVLISAVPPLMLKTEKNPGGLPISVFDGLRAAFVANRPQFYKDITLPFYGYNRPGAKILKNATLKVYPGFPHGMPTTNADQINADLLAFAQRRSQASA